jgi:hypothetical protein
MSIEDIKREIDVFIERTSRLLPQTFDSEDLLDDLRTHIEESFQDKSRSNPERDKMELIHEVFDEIGTPEEIAAEYLETPAVQHQVTAKKSLDVELIARLLFVILVCIISAMAISYIVGIEFWWALLVLLVFGIAEWAVRAKQGGIFKEEETP